MAPRFSPTIKDVSSYEILKQVGEGTYGFEMFFELLSPFLINLGKYGRVNVRKHQNM